MKNYWLERRNLLIEIKQVSSGNNFQGKWYVTKSKKIKFDLDNLDWIGDYDSTDYLHKDGKWRKCTINEKGEYTGYFDSEEDAINQLYKT